MTLIDSTARQDRLRAHLPKLAQFNSTDELEASALYRELKPEIERVLNNVVSGDLNTVQAPHECVRAVAWNIERGIRMSGVINAMRHHPKLMTCDLLMLSEVDYGMARTQNRFVAGAIAEALGMNYAFAPCYIALNKGNGIEKDAEGENRESLHGNALLSRYPMQRIHSLALPNGKDKMKGDEKRIGCQRAVIADIANPAGMFRAVVLHLDAHSSQRHRHLQMKLVLDHLEHLSPRLPVLIGGDWNTTTHDASRAVYSILGYFRRIMMGVRHVVRDHYPHPDRWFERHLFRELQRRGYSYREFNIAGECTLHYKIDDVAANLNLGEWVPNWCFSFIRWALGRTGGRCSMKLDWFAGNGIRVDSTKAGQGPAVIHDLQDDGHAVSDHDPIVLGFEA
jgi:endonuclease/exonuclease/phosphatase family metal-dependent hydrolase